MENLCLLFGGSHLLRSFRRIADHEVKRAGRDFTESCVSIERHCDANGWILTGEAEPSFKQAVVDFIYMKSAALFAQQQRYCLGNSAIRKAIAECFCVGA